MRVAFVTPTLGFKGGLERFVFDRAFALRARGHAVSLLYGTGRGREEARYAAAFDGAAPLGDRATLRGVDVALVQRASHVDEVQWLGDTPALVFAHDHDLSCVRSHRYLPLSHEPCHRAPGVSCVLHGCVIVRDRSGATSLGVRVRSPFVLRDDTVALSRRYPLVACSEYVRRSLIAAGVAPDRTHVAYPVLAPSDAARMERSARVTLLVIGSLIRGKGVDLAVAALAALDPSIVLRVVGDGPQRAELEALAAREAPGRVSFVGEVPPEAVVGEIDRASVVLVPARWPEPFGMTGIEAMQRGRPVVAARHGGIVEWLRDGHGVEGFRPGSAQSLAESVRVVLGETAAGDRAQQWASERWSYGRAVDEFERVLREAGPRAGRVSAHRREVSTSQERLTKGEEV
jgi:glycosyltransferase involved in cell wall biosynthesis